VSKPYVRLDKDNAAVNVAGRKQLIIAGVVTEVCVAFPALSALVRRGL
jgi:isochorismate hydrolase